MKGMMLKVSKNWMLVLLCFLMVGRACFAVAAGSSQSDDLLTSTTKEPTTLDTSTLPPSNTSNETTSTPVPTTSAETSTSTTTTTTTVKPIQGAPTKSPPTEPPTTKSQSGNSNSGEDNGNNGSGGSGSGRSDDSNGSRAGRKGKGGKGKKSADGGGLSVGWIIAIVVASLVVLIVLIVASIFAVRHFLKKKKNEKNVDIEANIAGQTPQMNAADFKPKPVKIQKPSDPAALKTFAPLKFKKMGPLRIQTKKPDVVPDLLSIKSEKSSQSTRNYEVHWDNENNEVYDIGSDVEILMDGDVPLPKKPKAVKTPAKTPATPARHSSAAAARTSGRKAKATEKQRDKAIRE